MKTLEKIQTFFSRKNVYFFVTLIVVLLLLLKKETVVFNPYWPIVLGLYEIFFQSLEKKIAEHDKDKVTRAGSILRTSYKAELIDEKIHLLFLEALGGEDSIELSQNDSNDTKLKKKIDKASETEKTTSTNIKDF